ncbi:hypothetical protein YC2023_064099 [Brassica napus]
MESTIRRHAAPLPPLKFACSVSGKPRTLAAVGNSWASTCFFLILRETVYTGFDRLREARNVKQGSDKELIGIDLVVVDEKVSFPPVNLSNQFFKLPTSAVQLHSCLYVDIGLIQSSI